MNEDVSISEKQLVVFDLNGESYAVNISVVREIIQMQPITRLPDLPESVIGVFDIRGSVIPVIDLRIHLKMEKLAQTKETRIIIVNSKQHELGIIVDAVTKVIRVPDDAFESSSNMQLNGKHDYLLGIAKIEKELVIILDMDHILSSQNVIDINSLDLSELKQDRELSNQSVK